MENYIVINGKRIDLTKEQIEKLELDVKKKSDFNKVEQWGTFYSIDSTGIIKIMTEDNYVGCKLLHYAGNYCANENLMIERAKEEVLNRLLWRFSMENGGDGIDWQDKNQAKWHILHDKFNDKWITTYQVMHGVSGAVYFIDVEVAERAIKEIVIPFYNGELEVCKIWEE